MEFNIIRFWNLCKRDFFLHLKSDSIIILIVGIIGGVVFMMEENYFYVLFLAFALFLGFRIFLEYSKKTSRTEILLLPVSNFERFLCVFLRAFIYYPICMIVSILFGTLLVSSLLLAFGLPADFSMAMQKSLSIFEVISRIVGKWYIFMAILFFGSIFYKKNAGIKMGLLGFGVIMLIALIMGIIFLIIGNNISWEIDLSTYNFSLYYESIAGALITVFFIALSYLRLTEEQA